MASHPSRSDATPATTSRTCQQETLADPNEVTDAVRFLANQGTRDATHELQLTPLAETWMP